MKAKAELAAARSINKDSGNEEKEEKEGKEEWVAEQYFFFVWMVKCR